MTYIHLELSSLIGQFDRTMIQFILVVIILKIHIFL